MAVARAAATLVLILTGTAGAQRDASKPSTGSAIVRGTVVAADSGASCPTES